mgnify:CR=1 FL=1
MLLALGIGFIFSYFFLWFAIPTMKLYFADHPNSRSSHSSPKARAGGIVFLIITLIYYFSVYFYQIFGNQITVYKIPLYCLPIAIVGLIDDKLNISSTFRFLIQVTTSILLILNTQLYLAYENNFLTIVLFLALLIISTSVINFTNFMDGIDGLVGGCMIIIISYAAFKLNTPWIIWMIIGSIIGFLKWNWFPAKIFMGDVGSTFLGSLYIGLLLQAESLRVFFELGLLSVPLFVDASTTVIRRFSLGENIFNAHKSHLYQRLNQSGLSHNLISSIYIAGTIFILLGVEIGSIYLGSIFSLILIFVGLYLDLNFAKKL